MQSLTFIINVLHLDTLDILIYYQCGSNECVNSRHQAFAIRAVYVQDSFTLWLRTYTLVPMGIGILMQALVALLACAGSGHTLASWKFV